MCKRRSLTPRIWFLIIAVTVASCATGLGLLIYGVQILPGNLPNDISAAIMYQPANQPSDTGAYSRALQQYQMQSAGFKFIIAGVGTLGGSLFLIGSVYCFFTIEGNEVAPAPSPPV